MGLTTCWFMNTLEREAQTLALGLRQRDPALLDHLIEKYQYRLFRYLLILTASRESAEDLFQETWMRVLEKGYQYRPRWKFETWLFTIARHLAIDFLRRRQPQSLDALLEPNETGSLLELEDTTSPSAFERAFQGEEAVSVATAMGRLPSAYREVLTLRFHEDMELEEIARVVDSPLSTVKSRLYRGLEAMRNLLEAKQV